MTGRLTTSESALARNSMLIEAAGLCCALGYHLNAAVCALRANMDHFQESSFYSLSGEPVKVARIPDDTYGSARLRRWIEYAIRDCASNMAEPRSLFEPGRTAVIILTRDRSHAHGAGEASANLVRAVMRQLREESGVGQSGSANDEGHQISVVSDGRTGLAPALLQAARYLMSEEAEQVLVIGVDSYLNAADINSYLQEDRLCIPGNSNGFLPGEAAAAVLVRRALQTEPGLHIEGVGMGREKGRHDGSVPSRSEGLTDAIRAACQQAKILPQELVFRISEENGEQFFARDAANAFTRVMFGLHKLVQVTLADKIGEIGAASGPAMLAWLSHDMAHPDFSPGARGILHLSSDDGSRCAVVLHHYGEPIYGNARLRQR